MGVSTRKKEDEGENGERDDYASEDEEEQIETLVNNNIESFEKDFVSEMIKEYTTEVVQ